MADYPTLRIPILQGLVSLKQQIQSDPAFFTKADCPYDETVKGILSELFATKTIETIVERDVRVVGDRGRPSGDIKLGQEDQQTVLDEIKITLADLNKLKAESDLETGAKIQIAKTKTGLLDQLLKMMERHNSVRRTELFKEAVIGILNDLVSEKDREIFQERLNPLR